MVVSTQAITSAFKSPALTAYKRSYQKRGQRDVLHEEVFRSLSNVVQSPINRVLYPGCHRHITASLVFPDVDYVDFDRKVSDVYNDDAVKDWVLSETSNDQTDESSVQHKWTFTCASYESMAQKKTKFKNNSYDLMISLSAGIVSTPCARYIRPGGYFLVNDAHADASAAFVATTDNKGSKMFNLVAAWEEGMGWKTTDLEDYFKTTKRDFISAKQAHEAAEIGSKSKRSFRLMKDAHFYLFRKSSSTRGGKSVGETEEGVEAKSQSSNKRRRVK
mmetsp:Transcript_49571/g.120286  ORF Transcript_49571/g.120286 Transcript_49571/m.120286 type:complete len:275 (+) Transcript_49571:3-827(+)